jgi:murein DD-endopeptidase MepM/ murein hydrolase activator NlpD
MKKTVVKIISLCILFFAVGIFTTFVFAETTEQLQQKITATQTQILKLEKEIEQLGQDIVKVQEAKKTLANAIAELNLTRKKLLASIQLTDSKITTTSLTIDQVRSDISSTEDKIKKGEVTIGSLIRKIDEEESRSLIEVALTNDQISTVWNDIESMQQFRGTVISKVGELQGLKNTLQGKKVQHETEKAKLVSLEDQLTDQKKIVEANQNEKTKLLVTTKNKETEYQKALTKKKIAVEAFEKEISDYESQIKLILDQSKLPTLGSGVLGWPLKNILLTSCTSKNSKGNNCITQYFGNTEFAKSGAYSGKGHNGMDFKASVGETLYASGDGVISGTGNTDAYAGCYSYGKWVLIKHNNGLSTLYAHMSIVKVVEGQIVKKGMILGYSGNTGYSTGPHLHYGVFATQGVSVLKLGDIAGRAKTACSKAAIPVAAYNAYLNPLDYLAQ